MAVFGKPGSSFVKDEVEKYVKRLRASNVQIEIVELKQSKRDDQAKGLSEEAAEFSKRFPRENYQWIVLAEEGKLLNTVQLADWIKPRITANCVFLFGSAYGIAPEIKKQASLLPRVQTQCTAEMQKALSHHLTLLQSLIMLAVRTVFQIPSQSLRMLSAVIRMIKSTTLQQCLTVTLNRTLIILM